ncbi:MAG TPA: 2,3-bisphosphoglycerate-dependent phosphoglycerate mutase [Candidatus Methylomirabilis sp.]|nr:2,3-bisphosphoglycerate-dependent phosphoglycerate mutase [Candidatus Methylomirabilis sp.]
MNRARTATVPVVLLRHAQSVWNLENRFTGWADVGLTEAGRAEARRAGALLRAHGYRFDRAFVSRLRRSTETLDIVLHGLGQEDLPVERSWRLNERHYGALEGLNKAAYAATHGARQLERVRRGLHERPPPLAPDEPRYVRHRDAYPDLDPSLLPATESLADTAARLWPYWEASIAPAVARGERVLVVSHGNTLRALVMRLENMSEHDVERFEIPTGVPLVFEFAPGGAARRYYLADAAGERQTLSIKQ